MSIYTYRGNNKYITRNGRLFLITERSQEAAVQAEWADSALKRENVQFDNGVWLHEAAGKILDESEDILVEYLVVTA